MRKLGILLSVALVLSLALPALAQEKPGNVGRVVVLQPKPGMAQQYEEGRKRHMDWHRKQNDPWTWNAWQVETGDGTGSYLSITLGHDWKDFDTWQEKFGKGDAEDATRNLTPYAASETNGFWRYLSDVSRPPDSKEPSKMVAVIHFMAKIGEVSEFYNALRKIHEAIGKTNWPPRYMWYALENGGEHPHFVLVLPRNSWAEMAPPEVPFDAMLEKALGRHDAEALMRNFGKSIQREWSEMLVYRPDLSYRPAAK